MLKDLKSATADAVEKDKASMLDQVQAAIDLLAFEVKKSKSADEKQRAIDAQAVLQASVDIGQLRAKSDPLTTDEALQLLRALDLSTQKIADVERDNRNKGYDGKTFTDRKMEVDKELATKKRIIDLLTQIRQNRDDEKAEQKERDADLRKHLASGLGAFLGPAGPLIEMYGDIKEQYGETIKNSAVKLKRLLGIQDNIRKQFDLTGRGESRLREKLFDTMNYQLKKIKTAVGEFGDSSKSLMEKIWDRVGGGGSKGKGGMFTRAKRAFRSFKRGPGRRLAQGLGRGLDRAKKLVGPGIRGATELAKRGGGRLMNGAATMMGEGKTLLTKAATAGLTHGGGLLKFALKRLPLIGALLSAHSLATGAESESSQSMGETAMAYGSGAMDGASVGAAVGSFIPGLGTLVGGAIGGVLGLLLTGIKRNWTAIKTNMYAGLTKTGEFMQETWDQTKKFFGNASDFVLKQWKTTKEGFDNLYEWLKSHIPGFGEIGRGLSLISDRVQEKAAAAGAAVQSGAAAVASATGGSATMLGGGNNSAAYTPGASVTPVPTTGPGAMPAGTAPASGASGAASTVSQIPVPTPSSAPTPGNGAAGTNGSSATGAGGKNGTNGTNSMSIAKFTGKLAMPSAEVQAAIDEAVAKTGESRADTMALINKESTFNPTAGAGTSSAKGLGQFTDGKWSDMVKKYGKEYDIGLGDRMDAKKNALMTTLLMRDNKATLKKEGLDSSVSGVYAMHMMGDTGGKTFLKASKDTPNASAASMFPSAAKSNPNVFYNKDGSPKTVSEVHQYMRQTVEAPAQAYAAISPKVEQQTRVASESPGANVSVAPGANNQQQQQSSANKYGKDTRSSGGTSVNDLPLVLGDNNMMILNSGYLS